LVKVSEVRLKLRFDKTLKHIGMAKSRKKIRAEKKNKEEGKKILITILGVVVVVLLLMYFMFTSMG
jgi:hypothetical protein